MEIQDYKFGKIIIDGRTYTSDLIIAPRRIHDSWWRKQGHSLCLDDLTEVLNSDPTVLIVGTGSSGAMKVPGETLKALESKGIKVHVAQTREAITLYQELQNKEGVFAALHLTC